MVICILITYVAVSVGRLERKIWGKKLLSAYFGACTFEDEGTAVTYVPIMVLPMLVFGKFGKIEDLDIIV